jgi:uncharacterized protein with NRDE domain
MCLIAWRWSPQSPAPLIWAANRDEFAHRATGALQPWAAKGNSVLSGLDLALEPIQGMHGTWAGINKHGKFAWLTNIRDPLHVNPESPSRGHLVSRYLCNQTRPADYLAAVHSKAQRYNGFNLVVGQLGKHAVCQHYNSATGKVSALKPGVYGLSNADLDSPWPKTRALVQAVGLHSAAQHGDQLNTAALFEALANPQRCGGDDLPSTGVPIEIEHVLSSAFIAANIRGNAYGTRSSTVGWVHEGTARLEERSFDAKGMCNNTVKHSLTLLA